MNKTFLISWPRSGRGAFVKLLKGYFAPELVLKYSPQAMNSDALVVFEHDVALELEVSDQNQYIVLVREPLNALMSWLWFEVDFAEKHKAPPVSWEEWAPRQFELFSAWFKKWLISPVPNRLILDYESLIENPELCLKMAVKHIAGEVRDGRVSDAVREFPIERRHLLVTDRRFEVSLQQERQS